MICKTIKCSHLVLNWHTHPDYITEVILSIITCSRFRSSYLIQHLPWSTPLVGKLLISVNNIYVFLKNQVHTSDSFVKTLTVNCSSVFFILCPRSLHFLETYRFLWTCSSLLIRGHILILWVRQELPRSLPYRIIWGSQESIHIWHSNDQWKPIIKIEYHY